MSDRLPPFQALNPESSESQTPEARVRHLIGSLETGVPELAENHRAYLLELHCPPSRAEETQAEGLEH